MAGPWRPKSLSPLRLSPIQYSPGDCFFLGSSDEDSPEVQRGKKRKRELLGQEYLRGRPPMILTAGLRGPFDDGWKNPWAKKEVDKMKMDKVNIRTGRSAENTRTRHPQTSKWRQAVDHRYMEDVEESPERERFDHILNRSSQSPTRTNSISKSSSLENGLYYEEGGTSDEDNYKPAKRSRKEHGRV